MAGPHAPSAPTRTPPLAVLGWGFYLAASWTWVIGMILPALMLRDFGWWGLVVFLTPNAIGAAAMGTVLRDAEAAKRLRQYHRSVITIFSLVTVAFHLYVVGSIAFASAGWPSKSGQFLLVFLVLYPLAYFVRIRHTLLIATGVWIASTVLAAMYWSRGGTESLLTDPAYATNLSRSLLMLAPVVIFGFALCPYLDATFLRARMETSRLGGKAAFAFGFLGPFVVMIGCTVLYSTAIISGNEIGWRLVLGHLAIQSIFTVGVHMREGLRHPKWIIGSVSLAVAAGAIAWALPAGPIPWADNMLAWEVVYRLFMSAYGLFFPAYVLYAMVPDALKMGPMTKAGRAVTAVTIAAVLPMYALGFIAREEQWLPLALGLILGGACITFTLRRRAARTAHG